MRGKRTIFVSCSRVWKNENVDVVSRVLEQGKKTTELDAKRQREEINTFLGTKGEDCTAKGTREKRN